MGAQALRQATPLAFPFGSASAGIPHAPVEPALRGDGPCHCKQNIVHGSDDLQSSETYVKQPSALAFETASPSKLDGDNLCLVHITMGIT